MLVRTLALCGLLLLAGCTDYEVTDRMKQQNKLDSIELDRLEYQASKL